MSRPIIAIDIDDVIATNAKSFVEFSNKRWGTHLTPEDYHDHWAELWGVDQGEAIRRADTLVHEGAFRQYGHFADALPVLRNLSLNFTLIIVTARRIVAEKDTKDWVEKHFPGVFSELHFAGIWNEDVEHAHQKTKTETLSHLGAQYLIDDQLKHCLSAAESNIQALLFGDYSWNQASNLPDNVVRVANWQEVEKYFEHEKQ